MVTTDNGPSQAELEAAYCADATDVIPRRPEMTAFRQRTRLHHARWREARGYPIGTQPISPRSGQRVRPVGSRMPFDYGVESGANFVTPAALEAARHRASYIEREQIINRQRLWADLLASEALAFNLFGDLAADLELADRAIHAWWPDAPGHVSDVLFLHSPGRLDGQWLNSLRDFHAAFVLEQENGTSGIVAVNVKYHERLTPETPKPSNLPRYSAVHRESGAFQPGALDRLKVRSDLWELWLEQLLLFSMLQHPSGEWTWGRYVVVHPQGNLDMADMCRRYRTLLADDESFAEATLEELLDRDVLPAATASALRKRYGE